VAIRLIFLGLPRPFAWPHSPGNPELSQRKKK
jgi:hypothetical protein